MTTPSADLPRPDELLPHRPPFLLVDRLTALEPGVRVAGSWTLTGEEWFFSGHFPGRPTLPGVLILEALAQVGACAVLADDRHRGKLPLFGGADKVKFRRQVVPGDRLDLEVTMGRLGSRAGKGSARASVGDDTAAQAELMFVLVDADADAGP
ncbi:MAG: 3-hydroxyacyl-ACP dehydratase FabZ [Acidimicrobiales bacterium]